MDSIVQSQHTEGAATPSRDLDTFDVNDSSRTKIAIVMKPRNKELAKKVDASQTTQPEGPISRPLGNDLEVDNDGNKANYPSLSPSSSSSSSPSPSKISQKGPRVLEGRVEKNRRSTSPKVITTAELSSALDGSSPSPRPSYRAHIPTSPPCRKEKYSCGCSTPEKCCRCMVMRLCHEFCFLVDDFEYRHFGPSELAP